MRLSRQHAVAAAIAVSGALLALAAPAVAAPPTLTSVTQSDGRISAEWTLPQGAESDSIEISKSRAVDGEGAFQDFYDYDALEPDQTSYTGSMRIPPGKYYVHVSSFSPDCDDCPIEEWSNIKTVTVPKRPKGPPPKAVPGLYAGPLGDLGARIRFRLARNGRFIRRVVARFQLNCSRAGLSDQKLTIKRVRVRKQRFRFKVRARQRGAVLRINFRGRLKPPRRAVGRLQVRLRDPNAGRCRILFGGRRGLAWHARHR